MRTVLLALGVLEGMAWAQPQTYTFVPPQTPQINVSYGFCTVANPKPQTSKTGLTFTVNVKCPDGFTAVGAMTVTFSPTTLTGMLGSNFVTTPLVVNASTSLTYTGGDPTQYSSGGIQIGPTTSPPACQPHFQTSESIVTSGCALSYLYYDASTGNIDLIISLSINAGAASTVFYSTVFAFTPSAFFAGADVLGSGVYYLQFPDGTPFGYYNFPSSSILYQYDMGFEAFVPGSAADSYLYDFTSSHWWYTSTTLFPYLYDFTLNSWIYYFPATNNPGHYTTNPRYFSNLTSGKIFTM